MPFSIPTCAVIAWSQETVQSELGLHLRGVDHCIDQLSPFGVVHYGKKFAVGDEVNVIPAFSFADYGIYDETVVAPAHALVKQPAELSWVEAAATWMKYVTAYGAFEKREIVGELTLLM